MPRVIATNVKLITSDESQSYRAARSTAGLGLRTVKTVAATQRVLKETDTQHSGQMGQKCSN